MKKNKDKRYCRKCGKELLQIRIGAEEVVEYWGGDSSRPHWEYDHESGKRQYGIKFKCPDSKWYNSHTAYTKLVKDL